MPNFTVIEQSLPNYFASYLINGDASGLEEGEEREINKTLEHLELADAGCVDVLDDSEFKQPPMYLNWLLAGDYSTFIFHKYN